MVSVDKPNQFYINWVYGETVCHTIHVKYLLNGLLGPYENYII